MGCRYAELLADNRGFTQEEDDYFTSQAQYAYESFRDKAALSRGMPKEAMQEVAQVGIIASSLVPVGSAQAGIIAISLVPVGSGLHMPAQVHALC